MKNLKPFWAPILMGLIVVAIMYGGHVLLNRGLYQHLTLQEPDVSLVVPRGWRIVEVPGLAGGVVLKRLSPVGHDDVWVQVMLAGPATATTTDQALEQLQQSYSQLPVKADVQRISFRSTGMIEAHVATKDRVWEFDRPVLGQRFHVLAVGHVLEKNAAKWRRVVLNILASVQAR